jgi:transcriptional regulator with XRE-family HTH domain
MRRVHRALDSEQIKELRENLHAAIPQSDVSIGEVIRQMRLITKRSQSEYARLCGVAPRALAEIESGNGNPRLSTLQALLRPFACDVGVVQLSDDELRRRRSR